MLESIIHGGQKVEHSRIAVRCRAWILSWRRKENHSFHLDSPGLFGSQEESLKHQLCIYFYVQVFVLHFALSVFFFSCPSSPPETAGIQLSVCVDCTSHHAATHTHTQAHTGLSPPPPISDRHRPSVTSKQHRGHCVGEHQHARFHHWLCSDTHTHMHTYSCVRILHTCAGGINAYSHRSVHPNLLAYTHTHTLTAIIRSPYLKIRGNSENKASSKAEWGRETWKEGREEWAGVAGRGGESMPMEQREWRKERRGEGISDVLWCPSCRFGSSATYLPWSVALFYPLLTVWFLHSHLITGLLLAESATVWQPWTHLGAYSHLSCTVAWGSRSWGSCKTEVWGQVCATALNDSIVPVCSVGLLVWRMCAAGPLLMKLVEYVMIYG